MTTDIEHRPSAKPGALVGLGFNEIGRLGKVFAESGMFKDTRSEAQAIVKIVAGQELGIGPMQSMNGIHVYQGKATLGAGLVGALVKRSGRYDYRVPVRTPEACRLDWFEWGEKVGETEWTIEQAQDIGLASKEVWKNYPAAMLFARAVTDGARTYCPDVFGGAVYTAEELGATNVTDEGELLADEPQPVRHETARRLTVKQPEPEPVAEPEVVEDADLVEPDLAGEDNVKKLRDDAIASGITKDEINSAYFATLGKKPPAEVTVTDFDDLVRAVAQITEAKSREAFAA